MGSRRHARIAAAISSVVWIATIAWILYVADEMLFLFRVEDSAVRQGAIGGLAFIKIVSAYAVARAVEAIGKMSVKAFSKDASEAGDVREPKAKPADPVIES